MKRFIKLTLAALINRNLIYEDAVEFLNEYHNKTCKRLKIQYYFIGFIVGIFLSILIYAIKGVI